MDPRTTSGNDVAASAIFKKFLSKAEGYIQQPTRLKQLLTDAYQKASEKNDVGSLAHEAWTTLQSLFRLVRSAASGEDTGVPGTTVAAAVAVLIYFLSPIDLIPDFIPVLGLLDDVALVAWFSTTVKHELDKFAVWESSSAVVLTDKKPVSTPTAGAYASTDKAYQAPAESAQQTATATASNEAKHLADALDEQAAAAPNSSSSPMTGTTVLSEPAQLSHESAKNHGTIDLPSAPPLAGPSATDAGLGSPSSSSSSTEPVHPAGPDAEPTPGTSHGDTTTNTHTTSSREGSSTAGTDTGGNVR